MAAVPSNFEGPRPLQDAYVAICWPRSWDGAGHEPQLRAADGTFVLAIWPFYALGVAAIYVCGESDPSCRGRTGPSDIDRPGGLHRSVARS